jgi:DnaJ-domain-containing protein 1
MTLNEIAVILFGLFAGYWVVSKLFFRQPKADINPEPASPPTATQWYDILQVPASASPAEIRDAYKHLISKYHPDKVDSLGQELKDLAGQKSQEINAAYQEGLRARDGEP